MYEEVLEKKDLKPFKEKIKRYDKELYEHSVNVARITEKILESMDYTDAEKEEIIIGAFLHDIGKTFIPESLLNKKEALTTSEVNVIKNHPALGYDLLCDFGFSDIVLDIVQNHHENEVGTGYPRHCIYMFKPTQIVSIADKFEAMTSKRSYKDAMSVEKAKKELAKSIKKITYGKEIFDALFKSDEEEGTKAQ